ncbi:MAG TPA: ABC transporter permease [Pyrinomonadaceae bacterium]|jgi:putative ABC transport system permease protein|nr:ABC transporter permease [Pyrinomonadaceae bacterium]
MFKDIRYSVRSLLKRPSFTIVALLTLALGIGANTTIFSIGNALLLKPFPFTDLERLVLVRESLPNQDFKATGVSPADFFDWQRQNKVFQELASYRVRDFTITGTGEPQLVGGSVVSENFFRTVGVSAALGRTFAKDENEPGKEQIAILGHAFWQRQFAGNPNVLGQTLTLGGRSVTVVGVMPPDFDFPFGTQVWMPLALTQAQMNIRDVRNLQVLARLNENVSVPQAQAEMLSIAQLIEQQYPQTNTGLSVTVVPMRDTQASLTRPLLSVLFCMAGLLLIIACANVGNLTLVRATSRQKELVIRAALGGRRSRIVRQLLTEGLLLAFLGGAFGLLISVWTVYLVKVSLPPDIARFMAGWKEIEIDGRVLAFNLAVGFLATLVFSLMPALFTSKLDLNEALKDGGRSSSTGTRGSRLRGFLVVSEVALALILLVGAGLMVKGFWNILQNFKGSNPETILTVRTSLPESTYNEPQKISGFYHDVIKRMESLPQVQSVGAASNTPLNNRPNPTVDFTIEGRPPLELGERQSSNLLIVSPRYFRTIGVPLLQGRDFNESDSSEATQVAVVSALMAHRYWPNEVPVGKRIRFNNRFNEQWFSVIGIVSDVKQSWFDQQMRPQVYLSYLQAPQASMHFMMATSVEPMNLAGLARAQIYAVDRSQLISDTRTLDQVFVAEGSPFRFAAVLMFAFGGIALMLSAVGVYSVVSYSVAQRTHEIGLRVALGAQRSDVLRMIVGQGLKISIGGLAIGLPAAYALGRVMSSMLFGIVTLEYAILIGFVIVLTAVALLSSFIPAWRATKVDPLVALRYE